MTKLYSMEELKGHTSEKDVWMAIHGKVYDVTKFVEDHPGGPEIMMEYAGADATEAFDDVAHSPAAHKQLEGLLIGQVEGYVAPVKNASSGGGGSAAMYLIPILLLLATIAYKFKIFG